MIALPALRAVGSVVDVTRAVVEHTVATAVFAVSVPGRIEALLDNAESLIRRVDAVVTDAAAAVAQANEVIGSTTSVVAQAATVAAQAQAVVESAGRSTDIAGDLLETYEPVARQAAPLASQFVDQLSPEEVHAAIVMLDQLPELAERMSMIMPILSTLDTVAPEIHELLGVAKDVRQAITGMPGFDFLRRRGEEKENGDD